MFYFFFLKVLWYMFIFYSVNRQADDNKDVNPSNCLNGYPGREKKTKTRYV